MSSSRLEGEVENRRLFWELSTKVDDRDDVEDQANDGADNTFARIVGGCGWAGTEHS
jgi:hypothetical protein